MNTLLTLVFIFIALPIWVTIGLMELMDLLSAHPVGSTLVFACCIPIFMIYYYELLKKSTK